MSGSESVRFQTVYANRNSTLSLYANAHVRNRTRCNKTEHFMIFLKSLKSS